MDIISFLDQYKLCDSHLHLSDLWNFESQQNSLKEKILGCKNYFSISCAHSETEYENQTAIIRQNKNPLLNNLFSAYGIHPQNPDSQSFDFLKAVSNDINAIGECGFDFYRSEYVEKKDLQIKVFEMQIELAVELKKPLVIHSRKAGELLFSYSDRLKKVPSVIFHSFMGTWLDAESLLNRGINGYFTFGKQILNGNKKAVGCVQNLNQKNLLLETDGPFQSLKGENYTRLEDILKVYLGAMELRGIGLHQEELVKEFTEGLYQNLLEALNIS